MSDTFALMNEITHLVAERDALNHHINAAVARFAVAVVRDLSGPRSAATSVVLEWDEEGSLQTFRAYDADSEEVRLFGSRVDERLFCQNNSVYVASLYRPGYLVAIELRDGSVEFISYGVRA